eukprot:7277346-Pyramimonas_sp.AAC.1
MPLQASCPDQGCVGARSTNAFVNALNVSPERGGGRILSISMGTFSGMGWFNPLAGPMPSARTRPVHIHLLVRGAPARGGGQRWTLRMTPPAHPRTMPLQASCSTEHKRFRQCSQLFPRKGGTHT